MFLVWWRAASAVHIFFPVDMATPDWQDYLQFFGIGSAIGSIFALIVFAAAAFSLPMMVDRDVDTVTAVVTSVNAVLRNKPAMAVWALCIVALTAAGFLTGYLGFVLIMPWLAYSAWHAYRATLNAEPWPVKPDLTG